MENQLETIKANLPYGYEKQIAKEVGCSQGTVHNILNNKPASARSTYKAKVLNVAVRMANEALEATKGVSRAAAELEILHHGSASLWTGKEGNCRQARYCLRNGKCLIG